MDRLGLDEEGIGLLILVVLFDMLLDNGLAAYMGASSNNPLGELFKSPALAEPGLGESVR